MIFITKDINGMDKKQQKKKAEKKKIWIPS